MPNRIIKESICSSESVDELTWFEEAFFYRLIVNCDDYGRFDARPAILRSRLFPLKNVTDKQIGDALNKLRTVGIALVYEYDHKPYLQLRSWNCHQQVRNQKSKYPEPPTENPVDNSIDSNRNQLKSIDSKCTRNPIQSESKSYSESESESNARTHAGEIVDLYHEYCPMMTRVMDLSKKRRDRIKALLQKYSLDEFKSVFFKAGVSDFISGRNGKWPGCNFDWLINGENFLKVLEGTYDNKMPVSQKSKAQASLDAIPDDDADPFGRFGGDILDVS